MMAARFRSVTWVGAAVVPALACYLVTQHVAAERAELAKVERQIDHSRRQIRDLETELGTRGSMAQLERWNGQIFALAAPSAEQFIGSGVQLASLTALPALPRPLVPAVPGTVAAQPAIVTAKPAPVPEVRTVALPAAPAATPKLPEVRHATFRAPAPSRVTAEIRQVAFKPVRRPERTTAPEEAAPLLHQTSYERPAREKPAATTVAMLANGPLDAGTLADIGRAARAERRSGRP